jgi:hypothetical protein
VTNAEASSQTAHIIHCNQHWLNPVTFFLAEKHPIGTGKAGQIASKTEVKKDTIKQWVNSNIHCIL